MMIHFGIGNSLNRKHTHTHGEKSEREKTQRGIEESEE